MNDDLSFINPPGLPRPNGFSHAAVAGDLVFISGQVAYDDQGRIVGEGDIAAQTRQVMQNLAVALDEAGSDFRHVLKLSFFVKDISEDAVAAIREARRAFLSPDALPASTMVGVAGLAKPALLLEVEAFAQRKRSS